MNHHPGQHVSSPKLTEEDICERVYRFLWKRFTHFLPKHKSNLLITLPVLPAKSNYKEICERRECLRTNCISLRPPIFFLSEFDLNHVKDYIEKLNSELFCKEWITKIQVMLQPSTSGFYVPSHFFFQAISSNFLFLRLNDVRILMQKKDIRFYVLIPIEFFSSKLSADHGDFSIFDRHEYAKNCFPKNYISSFIPELLPNVYILYRIHGGKGGFGALLKKSKKSRRRTNLNLDACRDLTGRRLRHSKVVERIKEWLEKKKKNELIVDSLINDSTEARKKGENSEKVSLENGFVSEMRSRAVSMHDIVQKGIQKQKQERKIESVEKHKKEYLVKRSKKWEAQQWYLHKDVLHESESEDDLHENLLSIVDYIPELYTNHGMNSSNAYRKRYDIDSSVSKSMSPKSKDVVGSDNSLTVIEEDRGQQKDCKMPTHVAKTLDSGRYGKICSISEGIVSNELYIGSSQLQKNTVNYQSSANLSTETSKTTKKEIHEKFQYITQARDLVVEDFESVEDLETKIHPEVIKEKLRLLGWKCGGRPHERASRLFLLKNFTLIDVPKTVWIDEKTRRKMS